MLPDALFHPTSVAVIGASTKPEKVGFGVFANLVRAGFPGPIYGVNPAGGDLLGLPLCKTIRDIPGRVDLGVFVVSPDAILTGIPDLLAKGMKAAIVISAGFKETGGEGARRERDLREAAGRASLRFLGPNCLGLINTHARLNASFSAGMPEPGGISFYSQSGALCTAVLDWALGERIGFSKFISLGNKADISESDVMEYLSDDPETRVILGYVESIEGGARFLSTARVVTRKKPVIVVKAGSTAAGARAAASHTGSLAGSDRAYATAFLQGGILRAESIEELFDLALCFALQPMPRGDRLLVLTNAGGPGIIAADMSERLGVPLAEIPPALRARMASHLPPTAALGNPVDVIGDARADRYGDVLAEIRDDPGIDTVLVLLTPQAMTEPEETARAVVETMRGSGKAVLASFLGDVSVRRARAILTEGGIPQFPFPERAVKALHAVQRYRRARVAARGGPGVVPGFRPDAARKLIRAALAGERRVLAEDAAREIFSACGFPFPAHALARTSGEAVDAFRKMGTPVAMKIASPDVVHKTDVGGVRLSLATDEDVAKAFVEITSSVRRNLPSAWIAGVSIQEMVTGGWELILGMSRDPQFGPLLMFGLGGIHVEVLKDVAFRVAGVSRTDAVEMIREIRSYPLLAGFRGSPPADEEAIVDAILRISMLSLACPEIQELDINPLVALPRGKGLRAIDCRMTVGEA